MVLWNVYWKGGWKEESNEEGECNVGLNEGKGRLSSAKVVGGRGAVEVASDNTSEVTSYGG